MPDVVSKSPESNYASRSEGVKSNIRYPTEHGPPVAGAEERAKAHLADQQMDANVVSVNGAALRASVDAVLVAQGVAAANSAGVRNAVAADITDALIKAEAPATLEVSASIDT
jgi:hypothetical protein